MTEKRTTIRTYRDAISAKKMMTMFNLMNVIIVGQFKQLSSKIYTLVEGESGVTSVLLRIFFYTECGHKDVERAYTL